MEKELVRLRKRPSRDGKRLSICWIMLMRAVDARGFLWGMRTYERPKRNDPRRNGNCEWESSSRIHEA